MTGTPGGLDTTFMLAAVHDGQFYVAPLGTPWEPGPGESPAWIPVASDDELRQVVTTLTAAAEGAARILRSRGQEQ